jgi:hypothetical protein
MRYYGKPSTYPYHWIASENGKPSLWSGVFKTRGECEESANYFNKYGKYKMQIFDRRKGR